MVLQYNLKSGVVIPPALFFLLRIALGTWGFLCLHMNFRICFFISVENGIGIFMGIELNL
jgi:hypothetical protein